MLYEDRYDLELMEAEVDAECYIGEEILRAGHAPFLPLANSVGMEESDMFVGLEFINADLTIIRNQRPEHSVIVLRQGWHQSEGANLEYATALDCGWGVIDLEEIGTDGFRASLDSLHRTLGPCFIYVAGPYRHWREEFMEIKDGEIPNSAEKDCNKSFLPCPGAGAGVE